MSMKQKLQKNLFLFDNRNTYYDFVLEYDVKLNALPVQGAGSCDNVLAGKNGSSIE